MDSTIENHQPDATQSLGRESWQRVKEVWSADTMSELGQSLKNLLEGVPVWALVIFFGVLAVMVNSSVVLVPLAAGGFLVGMFFTVKRAILSALREYDSQRQ